MGEAHAHRAALKLAAVARRYPGSGDRHRVARFPGDSTYGSPPRVHTATMALYGFRPRPNAPLPERFLREAVRLPGRRVTAGLTKRHAGSHRKIERSRHARDRDAENPGP